MSPCTIANLTITPLGTVTLPTGAIVPAVFQVTADIWPVGECSAIRVECSCNNQPIEAGLSAIGPPVPIGFGFVNLQCNDPQPLCDPNVGVSATVTCLNSVTMQPCGGPATVSGTVVREGDCDTFSFRQLSTTGVEDGVRGEFIWGNSSRLTRDQGGSIELGGTSSIDPVTGKIVGTPNDGSPYIDFHFGDQSPPAGAPATPAQDYNVRITNNADSTLGIRAALQGKLRLQVDGGVIVPRTNGFVRWGAGSTLAADQGGSIELVGSASVAATSTTQAVPPGRPYIDFRWGDSTTPDYNVRIINDADRQLNLVAQSARVSGNLHVTGTLTAGSKQFVAVHPNDPTQEVVYTCLEAGEAGTYVRGSASLTSGEAVIGLPEHFGLVTSAAGLTVHLTPRGTWLQLFVVEITPSLLIVREASGESGTFDYLVYGVRRGHENYPVLRPRRVFGDIPTPGVSDVRAGSA